MAVANAQSTKKVFDQEITRILLETMQKHAHGAFTEIAKKCKNGDHQLSPETERVLKIYGLAPFLSQLGPVIQEL